MKGHVVDARNLGPVAVVYIAGEGIIVPLNGHGRWLVWCPRHRFFFGAESRAEARRGAEHIEGLCRGCLLEREAPGVLNPGADLSALRYAQSSECGCSYPWQQIRLNLDVATNQWVPRCAGCGAVPTFIEHWRLPLVPYPELAGCSCGLRWFHDLARADALLNAHLSEVRKNAI